MKKYMVLILCMLIAFAIPSLAENAVVQADSSVGRLSFYGPTCEVIALDVIMQQQEQKTEAAWYPHTEAQIKALFAGGAVSASSR